METSPAPWINALRSSHDRLQSIVGPLNAGQVAEQSYCTDWSIAQVLSHLGSGAEIFTLFTEAGVGGQEAPGREAFAPIWDRWNAKSPQDQAADGLSADETLVETFESMDDEQLGKLRLSMFGMDLDAAGIARMRLGEHAVHTWDVAVARDPNATLAPDAVALLIDGVGQMAGRMGKAGGPEQRVRVVTTDPERSFVLETGDKVELTPGAGHGELPELRLPAEALIRLVYGRLDADHTPAATTSDVDLDGLRQVFPGF
jgi:uncharacterized protein (TIGR03083 family)